MKYKKKILFICSSPYTVFNCMNLTTLYNKEKYVIDILISHKSQSLYQISNNLKQSAFFNNVYDYRDFQNSKYLHVLSLLCCIFPKFMMNRLNLGEYRIEGNYDIIISQNYFFSIIYGRLNKNSEYYLIEDGLGSYISRVSVPDGRSKSIKLLNRLYGGRLIPNIKGQFVYIPEWIKSNRLEAYKLPSMKAYNKECYYRAFNYKYNTMYDDKKIVIFGDGTMERECLFYKDSSITNKYEIYKKYVLQIIERDKIIYRRHPIEIQADKYIDSTIDNLNNLWEIESQVSIKNEHILINFFSTAVVTPKILYNKEPNIIFLFPLIKYDDEKKKSMLDFVHKVKELYTNKDKIIVINNTNELKKILGKL